MRRGTRRRFGALIVGAALLPVVAATPVAAAGIVVNSKTMLTQDDGTCTLPEAIKAANTDTASGASSGECSAGSGSDTITFSVTGTIYTTRLPDITQPLMIDGNGTVVLDAQGGTSFFIANADPISLVRLVFTRGRAQYGGAIFVGGAGNVHLDRSTVSNSRAQQGGGLIVGSGGSLYVSDSTISGNTGTSTGGGIHLAANASVQIARSTVSGNTSPAGAGVFVTGAGDTLVIDNSTVAKNTATTSGGGVYASQNASVYIQNSTIALNSATTSHGGLYVDATGTVEVRNTIIAGNTNGNVASGSIDTSVANIVGGSITGLLDPAGLQANGGPTKTIKLLSTAAAALDDGNTLTCSGVGNVDQRGLTRGSPCDIGAVERDRSGPTATAPQTVLRSGTTLSGSSMRAVVRWSASDGTGSGIVRYQLQRRINGGTYVTVSSSLTSTSTSVTLANGSDYQFRVRGVDRDGNTGAFATGPVVQARLVQNTSASVVYTGSWTNASSTSYSGGSVRYATQTDNEQAKYSFTGSSVAFVTTTSSTRGIVDLYVDNVFAGKLDLYSASGTYRKVLFARSWPTSGAHSITIVSYGGTGRTRVDIDAFAVLR